MKTDLDVKSSESIKFNYRDAAVVPIVFLVISIGFFFLAYIYVPFVFDVFIIINLAIQIVNLLNMILLGYLPLLRKRKKFPELIDSPLVSIIIPAYNDGKILNETLKKLLELKYPSLEIIIIYSVKSTDNTHEIAKKYSEEYNFIRMIPEDISAANAKNLGFDNARADYVLVLDSDTYIKNGFLEEAVAAMEYDKEIGLIQARNIGLNTNQNIYTRVLWSMNAITTFFLIGSNKVFKNPCYRGFGALWRRITVLEAGKFSLTDLVDDYEFNCRLMAFYPKWKALFFNHHDVYEYYPSTLKDLFYQQLRWFRGAISLNVKYFFKPKKTKFSYKLIFLFYFFSSVLFPLLGLFCIGMYIIQFFLSFVLVRTFIFSAGNFLFYLGFVALLLTFIGYIKFAYSAYSKVLSIKDILFGIIIILTVLGLIVGIININALWKNLKREKKLYVKVSKEDVHTMDF